MSDHYADGTCRWWHLSEPSPELLQALADRWLPPAGRALDVGCGLGTEAGHLHRAGWQVAGVDLSPVAVATAARRNHGPVYLQADLLHLPLRSASFDAGLDRGEPRSRATRAPWTCSSSASRPSARKPFFPNVGAFPVRHAQPGRSRAEQTVTNARPSEFS